MAEKDRDPSQVSDRSAEVSLKLNNILTAMILGVMTWVGVSIDDLKKEVSAQNTTISVNQIQIQHSAKEIDSLSVAVVGLRTDLNALTSRVQRLER